MITGVRVHLVVSVIAGAILIGGAAGSDAPDPATVARLHALAGSQSPDEAASIGAAGDASVLLDPESGRILAAVATAAMR